MRAQRPWRFRTVTTSGDFFVKSITCGLILARGASCLLKIAFKPVAAGVTTGTLAIIHNGGGSPETTPLSGTGTGGNAPRRGISFRFAEKFLGSDEQVYSPSVVPGCGSLSFR